MDIVKFIGYRKIGERNPLGSGEFIEYRFKIADCIVKAIRRYTESFADNNEYIYRITVGSDSELDALHPLFVETLERICNEKDDMFFYNHILTNGGYHRAPGEIHDMLRDEFGLADIDIVETEETNPVEANVEWWVAHFIIQLQKKIFIPDNDEELFK